jgi:ABC-2 type transport system ATP-binding protein
MTENAIEIRALRKTYAGSAKSGPKEALKSVDLDIPKGSIFGLLGPNGAGKSTLINIMAGLVNKTSGSVKIWGFDQDEAPRQSRLSIGVVPQELNLDAFFTPRQSLNAQAGLYGVPRRLRRTDEILQAIGLGDKADAFSRTLSGGMRRRLLLGKALVHDAPVLVLDEPTAGVDIELRQMLWAYIRELNDQGKTIILTTHYLEEAEQMCDRIAIIDQGRVVTEDDTDKLITGTGAKTLVIHPTQPVTGDLPRPQGVTVDRRPDGSLAFGYLQSDHSAQDILDMVEAAGVRIRNLETEEPSLEEVFLQLTSTRAGEP